MKLPGDALSRREFLRRSGLGLGALGAARLPLFGVEDAIPHIALDAPLTADIEGLARPCSEWVKTSMSAETVGRDAAEAVAAARTPPGQVATLILPGDTAWNEGAGVADALPVPARTAVEDASIDAAAAALRIRRANGQSFRKERRRRRRRTR